MVKKSRIAIPEYCPRCGAKITNHDVNYCMKCGEMLWSRAYYGASARRFTATPAGKR